MTDTYTPNNSALILSNGTAIKEGDTKTEFQIKLSDIDNQPIDLTGATVQVYFSSLVDNLLLFYKTATISSTPTDGTISFHFDDTDMTGNGVIRLQFNVIYSDGSIEKFPTNDYVTIMINPSLDNLENTTISTYSMQQIIDFLTTSFTTSLNAAKTELQNNINTHANRKDNPHSVTKVQVGLGNVDNTSDANKPISTATQTALDAKVDDTQVVTTATANKILQLDANSKLPASITGNADGNSATSTKLQTARTIAISGDATGTATSFDGSSNIAIPLTLANSGVTASTYKSVTVDAKGRVTAGTNPTTLSGYGITDAVNTTDVVTTPTASKILKLDSNSKLPTSITGNADGNAATATKLQTSRTIGTSGDATGVATSFDGSANITIPLTLTTSGVTSGTYKSVTVDNKGRVTAGTNPTTLSGYGITDAVKKYSTQIGDGSATSYAITHNLNTQNCFVSVRAVASPYAAVTPNTIQMTSANTTTITFASAPTTNQYQVTVIG